MRTIDSSCWTSSSTSEAVGSSMISTRASCDRARAISTRCRFATDSAPTRSSTSMCWLCSRSSSSRARCRICGQSSPPHLVRGAWPMKMFSATVRSGNSSSSWCTTAMPFAAGGARRREGHACAVHPHLAAVGAMHAAHDLDQSRFAGAVLAQQRMHFAGAHVERDVLQHADAREGFGDAAEFDECASTRALPTAGRCRPNHVRLPPL